METIPTFFEWIILTAQSLLSQVNGLSIILLSYIAISYFIRKEFSEGSDFDEGSYDDDAEKTSVAYRTQKELERLKSIQVDCQLRNNGDFTQPQLEAWNVYAHQGINLPVDIVEDILYMNPLSKEDTLALIEIKRDSWKKDLSKKVVS